MKHFLRRVFLFASLFLYHPVEDDAYPPSLGAFLLFLSYTTIVVLLVSLVTVAGISLILALVDYLQGA